MKPVRNNVIRAGLEAFYFTAAHHLLGPICICLARSANEPLVAIGSHCNLANEREETARGEMATSRARIENVSLQPVDHSAYPHGDKQAAGAREFALAQACGFSTAVTTRPGMVFPESAGHLTALPRVSLNGNHQDKRILPVLTSAAATAMWKGLRRIDAA